MFKSRYEARKPDYTGYISYTSDEHKLWQTLIERQIPIVQQYACQDFLTGLEKLDFSHDKIPQCSELSQKLNELTGWQVVPVASLIDDDYFFSLLAKRQFPAATFIRRPDELDYLQEPDIFHEFFGHCPLLTNPNYADFMQQFGLLALSANATRRKYLGRLYWFTVEFGLLHRENDYQVYGAGILSSYQETQTSVTQKDIRRRPLNDGLQALRTSYLTNIVQPIYYTIESISQLYQLIEDENSLFESLDHAAELGDLLDNGEA